ncbi:MAG: hypothetical protein JKX85_14795, partial [Phycisphaeraceae bacterium]|nr:hypothetical protein [Phycisphaeraceae bacterium]
MSHAPSSFFIIIELPMWADSTNETITSGPHTDFQGAAYRHGPILQKMAGWYLKDSTIRIVEQG